MNNRSLVILTIATFLIFGLLLSIGIGISAHDKASELESRVSNLEYRIER